MKYMQEGILPEEKTWLELEHSRCFVIAGVLYYENPDNLLW